jgi:spore coat polysaccharide biosynthesis protein SpsF (cytidylyltransferase family)
MRLGGFREDRGDNSGSDAFFRLPGKVLRPILGRPMLALQIERIQRSILINNTIIATTDQSADDPIAALVDELGIGCFRGSEDDVLGRMAGVVRASGVDVHVEFMADNPLPDPLLIDSIVGFFVKHETCGSVRLRNQRVHDHVTPGRRSDGLSCTCAV